MLMHSLLLCKVVVYRLLLTPLLSGMLNNMPLIKGEIHKFIPDKFQKENIKTFIDK